MSLKLVPFNASLPGMVSVRAGTTPALDKSDRNEAYLDSPTLSSGTPSFPNQFAGLANEENSAIRRRIASDSLASGRSLSFQTRLAFTSK